MARTRDTLFPMYTMKRLTCAFVLLSACAGGGGGNQADSRVSGEDGGTSIHDSTARGGGAGAMGGSDGNGTSAAGGTVNDGSASSAIGGTSSGAGGTTGGDRTSGGRNGGATSANSGDSTSGGRSGGASATGGTATGGRGGAGGTLTGTGGSTHTGKWRIMLLGDSITDTTCYPKLLSQELISKGRTNFELVGTSLNNQSCGTAPNVQTEGHGCYLVTNLVKDVATVVGCGGTKGSLAELKTWAAEKPEVVLMQYGTNDVWSSIATQSILDAYGFVVDQFRAQNPGVIFFVAQITPLNPGGCTACEANVEALNAKIPVWASGKSTAASPIHVVNIWSALPAATYTPNSTYTSDGCHPNPAGSQLMADKWYEAITAQGIP